MIKIYQKLSTAVGITGTLACLIIFFFHPSFPTPDKLLIFFIFLFMAFHQTMSMLKHLLPFVVIILIYESFRGIVPSLNGHVNYTLAPDVDKFLFGNLPTTYLQNWLWHGHVSWYDFVFYLPYMLFFVIPFGLAILIWKTREYYYWKAMVAYSLLFFSSFLTFLLLPAAPPWLAAQNHIIGPITRISNHVWLGLGINNFPSVYNHIAPNPVAAIPSLHAAGSTLFSLLVFKLFGRRWGVLSMIYPLLIFFGVIYQGEHYAFDVIVGAIYGLAAYWLAPYVTKWLAGLKTRFVGRQLHSVGSIK